MGPKGPIYVPLFLFSKTGLHHFLFLGIPKSKKSWRKVQEFWVMDGRLDGGTAGQTDRRSWYQRTQWPLGQSRSKKGWESKISSSWRYKTFLTVEMTLPDVRRGQTRFIKLCRAKILPTIHDTSHMMIPTKASRALPMSKLIFLLTYTPILRHLGCHHQPEALPWVFHAKRWIRINQGSESHWLWK